MVDASLLMMLRVFTALSSFMVTLSPSPAIYNIFKTKSTGHVSIVPLVSLLANSHMWMMYGYFCGNIFPVMVSFGFGDIAALVYITVFYIYVEDRKYVRQVVVAVVAVLLAISIYAIVAATGATDQDYTSISHVMGYISIVAAIILYGAPFEKAVYVYRTKNAKPIQLPMVICGATNNALWVIYTPLDSNWFMFIPNAICVVLGIVLLTLYIMYRPGRAVQPAVDLPDDDIAITIVVTPKAEMQGKVQTSSPSFQPMPSPLQPLSRENSFQLSRNGSLQLSRNGSFELSRNSSFQLTRNSVQLRRDGSFELSSNNSVLRQ